MSEFIVGFTLYPSLSQMVVFLSTFKVLPGLQGPTQHTPPYGLRPSLNVNLKIISPLSESGLMHCSHPHSIHEGVIQGPPTPADTKIHR